MSTNTDAPKQWQRRIYLKYSGFSVLDTPRLDDSIKIPPNKVLKRINVYMGDMSKISSFAPYTYILGFANGYKFKFNNAQEMSTWEDANVADSSDSFTYHPADADALQVVNDYIPFGKYWYDSGIFDGCVVIDKTTKHAYRVNGAQLWEFPSLDVYKAHGSPPIDIEADSSTISKIPMGGGSIPLPPGMTLSPLPSTPPTPPPNPPSNPPSNPPANPPSNPPGSPNLPPNFNNIGSPYGYVTMRMKLGRPESPSGKMSKPFFPTHPVAFENCKLMDTIQSAITRSAGFNNYDSFTTKDILVQTTDSKNVVRYYAWFNYWLRTISLDEYNSIKGPLGGSLNGIIEVSGAESDVDNLAVSETVNDGRLVTASDSPSVYVIVLGQKWMLTPTAWMDIRVNGSLIHNRNITMSPSDLAKIPDGGSTALPRGASFVEGDPSNTVLPLDPSTTLLMLPNSISWKSTDTYPSEAKKIPSAFMKELTSTGTYLNGAVIEGSLIGPRINTNTTYNIPVYRVALGQKWYLGLGSSNPGVPNEVQPQYADLPGYRDGWHWVDFEDFVKIPTGGTSIIPFSSKLDDGFFGSIPPAKRIIQPNGTFMPDGWYFRVTLADGSPDSFYRPDQYFMYMNGYKIEVFGDEKYLAMVVGGTIRPEEADLMPLGTFFCDDLDYITLAGSRHHRFAMAYDGGIIRDRVTKQLYRVHFGRKLAFTDAQYNSLPQQQRSAVIEVRSSLVRSIPNGALGRFGEIFGSTFNRYALVPPSKVPIQSVLRDLHDPTATASSKLDPVGSVWWRCIPVDQHSSPAADYDEYSTNLSGRNFMIYNGYRFIIPNVSEDVEDPAITAYFNANKPVDVDIHMMLSRPVGKYHIPAELVGLLPFVQGGIQFGTRALWDGGVYTNHRNGIRYRLADEFKIAFPGEEYWTAAGSPKSTDTQYFLLDDIQEVPVFVGSPAFPVLAGEAYPLLAANNPKLPDILHSYDPSLDYKLPKPNPRTGVPEIFSGRMFDAAYLAICPPPYRIFSVTSRKDGKDTTIFNCYQPCPDDYEQVRMDPAVTDIPLPPQKSSLFTATDGSTSNPPGTTPPVDPKKPPTDPTKPPTDPTKPAPPPPEPQREVTAYMGCRALCPMRRDPITWRQAQMQDSSEGDACLLTPAVSKNIAVGLNNVKCGWVHPIDRDIADWTIHNKEDNLLMYKSWNCGVQNFTNSATSTQIDEAFAKTTSGDCMQYRASTFNHESGMTGYAFCTEYQPDVGSVYMNPAGCGGEYELKPVRKMAFFTRHDTSRDFWKRDRTNTLWAPTDFACVSMCPAWQPLIPSGDADVLGSQCREPCPVNTYSKPTVINECTKNGFAQTIIVADLQTVVNLAIDAARKRDHPTTPTPAPDKTPKPAPGVTTT